jgi:hypothetical protein
MEVCELQTKISWAVLFPIKSKLGVVDAIVVLTTRMHRD